MATFAIHTVTGDIVGLIRTQDDAPPPAVSGDPGYAVTAIDMADDEVAMSGADAEAQIREAFEGFRARRGPVESG